MAVPQQPSDIATELAQRGAVDQAYAVLSRAVEDGDATAAMLLAGWRMAGTLIRRDLAAARELYGLAAALGADEAEPVFIALLANGAGGTPRDWTRALTLLRRRAVRDPLARRQADLLDAMALDGDGNPLNRPPVTNLPAAAGMWHAPRFLTAAECRYVTDRAAPMLQPATVVDPQTGAMVQHPVRRAHATSFPFVQEDMVIHALNRRIAAAAGHAVDHGEPLQVLGYGPGHEYRLHSDALPPGGNQRVSTVLIVLKADFTGGATTFPKLGYEWRGKLGEALHFPCLDAAGQPDQRMWHAGLPVAQGVKLIASRWIRAAPLDLAGPLGRPF
ncbi:2OG-Fe(II) oxygenase [Croceibacterium ferulae]|uniref:2OG-Fe(II) oxygenase n=1 Tax=Croceibacterium ferulae TaxID=1854641 RepID=UPI0013900986|nr:2OG-Fe(II) oxygenase [Croceibacterium ferulae]